MEVNQPIDGETHLPPILLSSICLVVSSLSLSPILQNTIRFCHLQIICAGKFCGQPGNAKFRAHSCLGWNQKSNVMMCGSSSYVWDSGVVVCCNL
jgi:hypothetical protein